EEVELLPWARGQIKQELVKLGWPAEDLGGYTPGQPHAIDLDTSEWHLRPYQEQAVDTFFAQGSGVVVL
ncbi:helicase, partial [Bacillus sp. S34]|nr:helicase [Bacillus sp. S34]